MKKSERKNKRAGFTIVELLTVMAVIAILIGLLVPALNLVQDTAKDLQQRAQFHAIGVGLEIFKKEMGVYPESEDNQYKTNAIDTTPYTGANKLAEAMVGFDLMGFHPESEFTATNVDDVYIPNDIENLEEREERFIDIEKANAHQLLDIYGSTGELIPENYVLCDSFSKRRAISGKKIGSPILYFKANTKYKIQISDYDPEDPETVYNYYDNDELLALGSPDNPDREHDLYTDPTLFDRPDDDDEGIIINDQVETVNVPYNAQSYILMSAGKDGIFGNSDDIYNFQKEK